MNLKIDENFSKSTKQEKWLKYKIPIFAFQISIILIADQFILNKLRCEMPPYKSVWYWNKKSKSKQQFL